MGAAQRRAGLAGLRQPRDILQEKEALTMTDQKRGPGFDTLAIHAGPAPDPATGARQTPIYQTTSFVFADADHAASLFNLQETGFISSPLGNPPVPPLPGRTPPI